MILFVEISFTLRAITITIMVILFHYALTLIVNYSI